MKKIRFMAALLCLFLVNVIPVSAIEPFGMEMAEKFEEGYLSGYEAFKYDVPKEKCRRRAEERIKSSFEDTINQSVNKNEYQTIIQKSSRIDCKNGRVQYALLPVWTFNVKYKDKTYSYAVNGQTGIFMKRWNPAITS